MMMLNYLDQEMDMVNAMGAVQPTMKSSGLGDTEVAALYRLDSEKGTDVRFKFGLGLPTGSTDEKGLMMGNPGAILPYPMQLGSGTFDLKPGIEYTRSLTGWKWGAKADLTLRLGRNDEDYSLGNRLDGNLWGDKKVASYWTLNGALDYAYWGNIDGRDTRINPVMSPYGDPDRQGGQRLDARFGFTYLTEGGTKFGVDYATPIYQDLDGPQMELERIWSANLQIMF